MGLFLQTVILKDKTEAEAREAFKTVLQRNVGFDLKEDECRFHETEKGTVVLMNNDFAGYEAFAEELSILLEPPVMLLYIYDGDFWGYFLYHGGKMADAYHPMPDYFEEQTPEAMEACRGKAGVVAGYFSVPAESIENYLVQWTEDMEYEDKAYPEDEFTYEDWQMADFMKKLGFPYVW